ncbi:nuclear transport factor 2 family protein [Sabulicella rubraurantiaca]|uniref:nuclear transport factor 2 family protein n=1 Tax=Sabulicella rubraurantiaca TaxID=2811429 RepID=UPI0022A8CE63|nr:nuclear transport factor 2 family protein [Sabulicella rubraurantiaca]
MGLLDALATKFGSFYPVRRSSVRADGPTREAAHAPTCSRPSGPAGLIVHGTKASAEAGVRRAIDVLMDRFAEACDRRDSGAIATLFTEDGILSGSAPILIGRPAIAQNYKSRLDQGFGNIRFQFQHYAQDGTWTAGSHAAQYISEALSD